MKTCGGILWKAIAWPGCQNEQLAGRLDIANGDLRHWIARREDIAAITVLMDGAIADSRSLFLTTPRSDPAVQSWGWTSSLSMTAPISRSGADPDDEQDALS
jgi:hypothetical protein